MNANVTYNSHESVDATGARVLSWRAHAKVFTPHAGLAAYQQIPAPQYTNPIVDALSVHGESLEDVREKISATIQAIIGTAPTSLRFVDLREFNASPAACEEFRIIKERREAA